MSMIRNLLEPSPMRLDVARHCDELMSNDLMIHEWLAECVAVYGICPGVFQANSGLAVHEYSKDKSFFVEVCLVSMRVNIQTRLSRRYSLVITY